MRPVALDRKNWIHIGSPQADPQVAAILSVAENCRRLKLPVRDYLTAVLPGLADLRIQRLPELLPVWGSPGIHGPMRPVCRARVILGQQPILLFADDPRRNRWVLGPCVIDRCRDGSRYFGD